jgi:hypothetical protein
LASIVTTLSDVEGLEHRSAGVVAAGERPLGMCHVARIRRLRRLRRRRKGPAGGEGGECLKQFAAISAFNPSGRPLARLHGTRFTP